MNQTQLIAALTYCKYAYSGSGDIANMISNLIKEERAIINSKQRNGIYFRFDLSDEKTWMTYSRCIDLRFSINENNKKYPICCDAKVYNGNNMDGCREDLRFIAQIFISKKDIKLFEEIIERSFNFSLNDSYEKFLEKEKRNWVDCEKKAILNSHKNEQ